MLKQQNFLFFSQQFKRALRTLGFRLLPACVCLNLIATPAFCQDKPILKAVTVIDNFPYSFVENGVLQGLSIDLMRALAERAGYQISIETQPPTRALKTAETESSVLIFSIFRTPVRENWYYWIGPFSNTELWLYKLKSRTDISVQNLNDAKKYLVGVTASDGSIPTLNRLGIKMDTAPSDVSNCKKFKVGRFDLILLEPNNLAGFLTACAMPADSIEKLVKIPLSSAIYAGIGKRTPIDLVNRLRTEMEGLRRDQTIQKFHAKWLGRTDPALK